MMIYILFVSWVVTAYVVADALYPIKSEDLKSIVESVKKDVDRHLKMAYAGRRMESISVPELSAVVEDADNGEEYQNFMKVIQDSMHHHLVRNLGQPTDAENDGSTDYIKPTPGSKTVYSTESASEQVSTTADEDRSEESSSEIYEIRFGSKKGVPGINFPDYTDIPITPFTCTEKPSFPGFYADLDTGCQVFHVCWPDRRESFLCPMGTTFNQALRVCDYWYNSNCSLAPYYYLVNAELKPDLSTAKNESVSSMIDALLKETDSGATQKPDSSTYDHAKSDSVMSFISQLIPVKAKIVVYPKTATQRSKIVATASMGESKKSDFKQKPRRKNTYTSKHSRVPRSLEYMKPTKDTDQNTEDLPQYPLARTSFLLFEALDRAIMDIESNETFSYLSGYAKTAVKNIKSFFLWLTDEPLENFNPEPGSEMYKEDMEMRENMEDDFVKNMLLLTSVLMDKYHEKETEFLRQRNLTDLFEASKSEPLTNLNPRFVIKPAAEETPGHQNKELPTFANRVKRSATVSNPTKLSHEDSLHIHPETKKLLLKSYMKVLKTKHRHA